MGLITIYFKPYTFQEAGNNYKGTEYFKDMKCKIPMCRDPWVCHRKNHIAIINGWRFNAIKVN